MLSEWQISELINLVRCRYPAWSDFDDPPFVADEIAYKRKAAEMAATELGAGPCQELLKGWRYDELLERTVKIGRQTNLLWLRVPRQGDLNILLGHAADKAELCQQLVRLWHGSESLPDRLQGFGSYALARQLPLKWPFVTYYPFLLQPEEAIFVKPTIIKWALQFAGLGDQYARSPTGAAYATILALTGSLRQALAAYGAQDMIDVQSFLWVAAREAREQTGRLTPQGQIDLDVPLAEEVTYEVTTTGTVLGERKLHYDSSAERVTEAALVEKLVLPAATVAGWLLAIRRKRQAVFQGPPGTGKSYAAQLVARHLVGAGDGFVELVQFHPNYAYEEFIQGIRPVEDSFELTEGRFLSFCRRARQRQGACVLIIDEMNRAPLARVFGELMFLLEYRDQSVPLAAGGQLAIPANVIILGTMNSADRSIALVDFALRRRFAFLQLKPNYDLLRHFLIADGEGVAVEGLIGQIKAINDLIGEPDYALGVSFFLVNDLADAIESIWLTEIEPYLTEYFFDQPDRIEPFRWANVKSHLIP